MVHNVNNYAEGNRAQKLMNFHLGRVRRQILYISTQGRVKLSCLTTVSLFYCFVVEMEMTILGSRHFLLFPSQMQFVGPKLRFCVMIILLGFLPTNVFILNFDDFWKSVVIGDLTPSGKVSCILILSFLLSTFQRLKKFLLKTTWRIRFVHNILETCGLTVSSQSGFSNFPQFQFLLPLRFFTSTSQRPWNYAQLPEGYDI